MKTLVRWWSLVVVLVWTVSSSAAAPSKALMEDAASYAAATGVDQEEAVRRLRLQRLVGELDAALTEEDASFAGLWIEHKPYRIIARFTERAGEARLTARLAGGPLEGLVETRSARSSVRELEQRQKELRAAADAAQVRLASEVDIPGNRIRAFSLLDTPGLSARLAAAGGRLPQNVEVERVASLPEPDTLIGGAALNGCTAGFAVRAPNGELGISTAGHCYNDQYYAGIYLPFRADYDGHYYDVQWNSTCGRVDVSNKFESGIGVRSVIGTRSRSAHSVGQYVCKYGQTTLRTCGYVSSKSYDPGRSYYTGLDYYATFIRVDGYRLRDFGDSGGPWYDEDIALGIHHSAAANDANDAVYMAINYISGINVSVLTYDPGPGCVIPPVARYTYTYSWQDHSFDASASYDPNGSIVSYTWDFGDGYVTTTTSPYITHTLWGEHYVTLTVTDSEGATASYTRFIRACGNPGQMECPY